MISKQYTKASIKNIDPKTFISKTTKYFCVKFCSKIGGGLIYKSSNFYAKSLRSQNVLLTLILHPPFLLNFCHKTQSKSWPPPFMLDNIGYTDCHGVIQWYYSLSDGLWLQNFLHKRPKSSFCIFSLKIALFFKISVLRVPPNVLNRVQIRWFGWELCKGYPRIVNGLQSLFRSVDSRTVLDKSPFFFGTFLDFLMRKDEFLKSLDISRRVCGLSPLWVEPFDSYKPFWWDSSPYVNPKVTLLGLLNESLITPVFIVKLAAKLYPDLGRPDIAFIWKNEAFPVVFFHFFNNFTEF